MRLQWLEDFIVLADCRSFTRAAEIRYASQSTLSRRIRSLEQWAGVDLIERGSTPMELTAAGQRLREKAESWVYSIQHERHALGNGRDNRTVQIAAPNSLAVNFFPGWWCRVLGSRARVLCNLHSDNHAEAIAALESGKADLALTYGHASEPVRLNPERFRQVVIGQESLVPVHAAVQRDTTPCRLPGTSCEPVPWLSYSSRAYIGRVLQSDLSQRDHCFLQPVVETHIAECAKKLVLQGIGVAWLPLKAIRSDLASGRVVPAGTPEWHIDLDILLHYPNEPRGQHTAELLDLILDR